MSTIRAAKAAKNAHYSVVLVLAVAVIVVMVVAPFAGPLVTRQVQSGCASGEIDHGICWAAQVGGLVTPPAETNTPAAPCLTTTSAMP